MGLDKSLFCDLPERIAQDFNELDSNICRDLSGANEEYASLRKRSLEISERYPVIEQALEDAGAISLTAEEHAALVEYMSLAMEQENLERLHIYFRGHTDCFSYLKTDRRDLTDMQKQKAVRATCRLLLYMSTSALVMQQKIDIWNGGKCHDQ